MSPRLACVASVSVWFWSKERPENASSFPVVLGDFGCELVGKIRQGLALSHSVPSLLASSGNSDSANWPGYEAAENGVLGFGSARRTRAIFRAVFDSRSSFFAPKPHGNVCYAG